MTMEWLRLHHEIIHDIKLRKFSPQEKWAWVVLLVLASESSDRGIITADSEDIADICEFQTTQDWLYYLDKLIAKGMVEPCDKGIKILHWDERQYTKPSDKPEATKERKRNERMRKKSAQKETQNVAASRPVTPLSRPSKTQAGEGVQENKENMSRLVTPCHALDPDPDPDPEADPDPDPKPELALGGNAKNSTAVIQNSLSLAVNSTQTSENERKMPVFEPPGKIENQEIQPKKTKQPGEREFLNFEARLTNAFKTPWRTGAGLNEMDPKFVDWLRIQWKHEGAANARAFLRKADRDFDKNQDALGYWEDYQTEKLEEVTPQDLRNKLTHMGCFTPPDWAIAKFGQEFFQTMTKPQLTEIIETLENLTNEVA